MKAEKPSSLEDAISRLLEGFSPNQGRKLAGDQLRTWAEHARACLADLQRRIIDDGSSVANLQRPSVENLSSLASKIIRNASKLEEIASACRLAFTRWQKEDKERERNKLNLLKQLESTLQACLDKSTQKTSTIGLIRHMASFR